MTIVLGGKRKPERKQLLAGLEDGIEIFELYLEEKHLDSIESTVQEMKQIEAEANKQNSRMRIVSLHTPHGPKKEYIYKSIELAKRLDCWAVLHAHEIKENLAEIIQTDHPKICVENRPMQDLTWMQKNIFSRSKFLCLDVAHLYMSTDNYEEELQTLLNKHKEKIKVIHFNGAAKKKDGLSLSEGQLDIEKTARIIKDSAYDGIIIVETPLETQKDDYQKAVKLFLDHGSLQNKRLIIFDADKTLYDIETSRAYGALYSFLSEELEVPHEKIREAHKKEILKVRQSLDPEKRNYQYPLKAVIKRFLKNEDSALVERASALFWQNVVENLVPKEGVIRTLQKLSQDHILAIATDEFFPIVERKLNKIFGNWNEHFRTIVSCDKVNTMKPSKKYYEELLSLFNLKAEQAVVIGDSWTRDLAPAKELGMQTILISEKEEGIPDRHIKKYSELLALFGID